MQASDLVGRLSCRVSDVTARARGRTSVGQCCFHCWNQLITLGNFSRPQRSSGFKHGSTAMARAAHVRGGAALCLCLTLLCQTVLGLVTSPRLSPSTPSSSHASVATRTSVACSLRPRLLGEVDRSGVGGGAGGGGLHGWFGGEPGRVAGCRGRGLERGRGRGLAVRRHASAGPSGDSGDVPDAAVDKDTVDNAGGDDGRKASAEMSSADARSVRVSTPPRHPTTPPPHHPNVPRSPERRVTCSRSPCAR